LPLLVAFGAVVSDGYAVAYNIQNSRILLATSTFRSCAKTDTAQFGMKLKESLLAMKDVVSDQHSPKL